MLAPHRLCQYRIRVSSRPSDGSSPISSQTQKSRSFFGGRPCQGEPEHSLTCSDAKSSSSSVACLGKVKPSTSTCPAARLEPILPCGYCCSTPCAVDQTASRDKRLCRLVDEPKYETRRQVQGFHFDGHDRRSHPRAGFLLARSLNPTSRAIPASGLYQLLEAPFRASHAHWPLRRCSSTNHGKMKTAHRDWSLRAVQIQKVDFGSGSDFPLSPSEPHLVGYSSDAWLSLAPNVPSALTE